MTKQLELNLVEMTPEIMEFLEDRGILIRLCPGTHEVITPAGQVGIKEVYRTDEKYGSHMLITATVNRSRFSAFGTHPENEDVFLVGDPNTKPMAMLFALCERDEFIQKMETGNLKAEDFVALRARFNDPEVSMFTVCRNYPHGEAVMAGEGKPPTFFVTEQTNLPLDIIPWKTIEINIQNWE